MSAGGFLSAVGDAFSGYAADKKNRAEQSLRDQQTRKLQREEADAMLLQSPEFGQAYGAALTTGDPTAIGNVVRLTAGHPQMAEIIKSMTREPKPDATTYDESRGVIINRATGSFTAPKGLPPKQYKPTETDGLAAMIRQQRFDEARAKHDAALAAAETEFNTRVIRDPNDPAYDPAAVARQDARSQTFKNLRRANPHADARELMAIAFQAGSIGNTATGLEARTDVSEGKAAESRSYQAMAPKISGAPSTVPTQRSAPAYSSDPNISAAQRIWDSNPEIQIVRARPQ